jgi:hypothetical protein
MLLQLRAGHAEGSRTHYLAESGVNWGNWQGILLVKNEKRPGPACAAPVLGCVFVSRVYVWTGGTYLLVLRSYET